MIRKTFTSSARVFSLLVLSAVGSAVSAQERWPVHFSGVLNDYTPTDPNINGSPYEMHGQWSVDINRFGAADFYADMTMSGYGTTNNVLDATKGGQNPHTHHIRLTNIKVTWNMTGCPLYSKPVPTGGFQISGTVSLITGNGNRAPFEAAATPPLPPPPLMSKLQVCVLGGAEVPYSNMTMVFAGPAASHFGTQAIHGVVRKVTVEPERRGVEGPH